jgi:class 3 adenylate cyclase
VAAAIEMQRAFAGYVWPAGETQRVRMGVHTGEVSETADGLVGLDVHRARIAAAAHGGQFLVSATTAALAA